jgi:hypothetical protein
MRKHEHDVEQFDGERVKVQDQVHSWYTMHKNEDSSDAAVYPPARYMLDKTRDTMFVTAASGSWQLQLLPTGIRCIGCSQKKLTSDQKQF